MQEYDIKCNNMLINVNFCEFMWIYVNKCKIIVRKCKIIQQYVNN